MVEWKTTGLDGISWEEEGGNWRIICGKRETKNVYLLLMRN